MRLSILLAVGTLAANPLQAGQSPAPPTTSHAKHTAGQSIEAILARADRAEDRARDEFRHPAQTLAFFGVEPGMTVVDYMPSGGWYTRVLVPYLGAEGRYIGVNPDGTTANNPQFVEYASKLTPRFKEQSGGWNLSGAPVTITNSNELTDDLKGQVDRVMIFREMHNLHRNGIMHQELTRLHGLLKPDGMLGIVQHRAKADAAGEYTNGSKGYMRQKDVIGLVEAHGFQLVESSEINANPRDTADHERGVWEMPPSLSTRRADLRELGESDRMTLLFRKR